jgi:hypothetical protein
MGELEQLHTALPFGEPKLSESIREALVDTSPAAWVISSSSMLVILFSIALVALGMSLLQRNPRAIGRLKWWASLYIIFTITTVCLNWVPRLDLIQTDQPILALFLAQLMIYLPLYLLLPFFLLVYLNLAKVRNELKLWR